MTEKTKLLVVADTYHPKVDGTLIFMQEFIERTKEFDISLLVPHLGVRKGKDVTYIDPSKWIVLSGYPNMKLSLKNLKKIKNSIKAADMIFIQGPSLISYLSMYYGKKYEKKTIAYPHVISWELFEKTSTWPFTKILSLIIKRLSVFFFNCCDEILVPYQDLKDHLRKEGIRTKMSIARLGVDIDKFSPSHDKRLSKKKINIQSKKFVIGFVGRISKEKNITLLLEAFKRIEDQTNIQLLIVGDGEKEIKTEFKKIKNCKITGFVDNVQDYLKAMDIFVMPSLTETTSLATLEAMSCGLPVIATKVGFIKNYLVKDHNGLFFPRNKSTVLALKLQKLIDNKELREKLGKNARKTIAYSFSWERSINKIKRILLKHIVEES